MRTWCSILLALTWGLASVQEASSEEIDDFGRTLAEARINQQPLSDFSSGFPDASLSDAYQAQRAMVRNLTAQGEVIAGYKGGMVSVRSQKAFGLAAPLGAVLFRSGWLEPAELSPIPLERLPDVGIETEVGFILAQDVTAPLTSPEQALAVVARIVPVIELPSGKREGTGPPAATSLAAANVMSSLYIVGEGIPAGKVDPDSIVIRLARNGRLLHETSGADAAQGQWHNLMFQINHALSQGFEVKEGQLIITGALGVIQKEVPGKFHATWSGGLGEIRFTIR